jgi:glycosyltransferase involved in cell wall biosynthesis
MPEVAQLGGELERDELGAATLTARHHMEDPHRGNRAMPAPGGAVFVVPSARRGQLGPVASWVSTAGWADAARRVLGHAWIVTVDGVLDPSEMRRRATAAELRSGDRSPTRTLVPVAWKTAAKDARQWWRAHRFTVPPGGPWQGRDVAFVWQRHELFHDAGIALARTVGAPAVVFVPATHVWEAGHWGVRRRGWSGLVEARGEARVLRRADLVACGSDAVAEQVARLGVAPGRLLVTPTGVDVARFAAAGDRDGRRGALGLDGRFVVGWVGSFRRFHAVEQAVDAAQGIEGCTLLLVGDGPERARIEELAAARGVHAVFAGTVAHDDVPSYLGAMDVALVLAARATPFHYSPLKLAEYLAAGVAVVAPRAGDLPARLVEGEHALLVPPGDVEALRATLRRLRDDSGERARLAEAARAVARTDWSWDRQVERVLDALGSARGAKRGAAADGRSVNG